MIITIAVLVVLTIAVAAFVLAPRLTEERIVYDVTPDRPASFGCSMSWLAIRTTDQTRLCEVLGLAPLERANWSNGIGTAYDDQLGGSRLYLTPPVDGWTFVVGLTLPQPLGPAFVDKCTPMLLDLAAAFPEAQYYLTFPTLDFYAWARVVDGKLVRAYAIGDEGLIWNKGRPTKDEREFGITLSQIKGVRKRKGDTALSMLIYPTETHVVHLAGRWSIDPSMLSRHEPRTSEPPGCSANAGLGLICCPPARWLPERLRRTG
ncbi:MAG: hypothetical protein AB7O38_29460 [Pirellulaceae bacterium]